MWRRRLRSVGLVLVVLGAVVLVGPTLGFDSIEADRGVSADAATNPNAQLGLQEDYDGSEIVYTTDWLGRTDQVENQTVANVTNRVGNPLSVSVAVESVQWQSGNGPALEVSNRDAFLDPMATNTTRPVRLGCSRDVGGSTGNATVELSFEGSGDPVSVSGASMTIEGVSLECAGTSPGDGDPPTDPVPIDHPDVNLTVSDPSATGGFWWVPASLVTFGLENTGDQQVTVSGIYVSDADSATRIMRYGNDEVVFSGDAAGGMGRDNGISIGPEAPRYDFDQNATLSSGDAPTVEIGRFRNNDGQVGMNGESVTIVLYVDGLDVPDREGPVPVEIEMTPS